MPKAADTKTLNLIQEIQRRKQEIQRRKQEIEKSERPNFRTNLSFSYTGKPNDARNIHVESDVAELIRTAAFIRSQAESYYETAEFLGLDSRPPFTWQGFSVEDWMEDIKLRIAKIQIASKKRKLEELEARPNAIVSPELRAQMELEAIAAELD